MISDLSNNGFWEPFCLILSGTSKSEHYTCQSACPSPPPTYGPAYQFACHSASPSLPANQQTDLPVCLPLSQPPTYLLI